VRTKKPTLPNPVRLVTDRATSLRVLLVLLAVQLSVGCSSSKFPSGELVMFSTVGPRAFQGTVFVVRPDGSSITTVLKPQTLLEYNGAYGNSLKTFVLASSSQSTGGNNAVANIVQYFPGNGTITPLQQQLPMGQEAIGVPSPDNSQFVAGVGPAGTQLNLWISDFKTKEFRQLTDGPAQDFNAAWRPDGQQIAFTRLLPPFPSITTQLLTVLSSGGPPTILLGTSDHVGEAAYSRDGKHLAFDSINGLETIDLTTMQRKVILTLAQLHGSPPERLTEGVGMSWGRTQDTIVLILKDLGTSRDQLWTVSSDGSNFKKIYTADAGAFIQSVCFVEN
jgi:WD40-like Beta Propeller Repeat